ncbi:MAG: hypothetical protein ACI90E_002003, partial [Yoonia sp.]
AVRQKWTVFKPFNDLNCAAGKCVADKWHKTAIHFKANHYATGRLVEGP